MPAAQSADAAAALGAQSVSGASDEGGWVAFVVLLLLLLAVVGLLVARRWCSSVCRAPAHGKEALNHSIDHSKWRRRFY